MIQQLKDAIDIADKNGSKKIKAVLLEIAKLPEDKQETTMDLIKHILGVK